MTVLLDKHNLFSTFNVNDFNELESSFNNISPSMAEYYLSDLAESSTEPLHLNRSNIQNTLKLDSYSLYLDYSDNIYLEFIQNAQEFETATLW